jgi:hypothetical protein
MSQEPGITVKNKLIKEKRDINVYHQATRSAHIISRNSSITLPLRASQEEDYLHISVISGPGNLWKNCLIDLPSWADFEFSSEGKMAVTHSGDRMVLNIPPGPPTWQLKITRPNGLQMMQTPDHVIIGDEASG